MPPSSVLPTADGRPTAEGPFRTMTGRYSSCGEGLCIGCDGGAAVSRECQPKFPFTGGRIIKVTFDVVKEGEVDVEQDSRRRWRATEPIINGAWRDPPMLTTCVPHARATQGPRPCVARIARRPVGILIAAVVLLLGRSVAAQQPSGGDVNAANNPLTPKITINFHDQWAPELYDVGDGSNAFLFRGLVPHKLAGARQLFRYTLPVVTAPDPQGTVTGLGDLNLIDLIPFVVKRARMEIAVGPQLTLPTATNDVTGTGKWQGGLAVLAVAPRQFGIAGALITWQHSFAGDDDRASQNNLAIQPLFIYNLPQGWYLRSTATLNFAFAQDTYVIPIGGGIGKVWVRPGATVNAFAEPQFTVAHDGVGQPEFQMFMGLNLQFPLGRQ